MFEEDPAARASNLRKWGLSLVRKLTTYLPA